MKTIKLSLNQAAIEFHASKETVARGLKALGVDTGRGKTFTIHQIHRAIGGDLKFERARRERAEADRAERENRAADGELVQMAEVEKMLAECVIQPLSALLRDLPTTLDTRCNPENPALARRALLDWVERTCKPQLRDKLPKIPEK